MLSSSRLRDSSSRSLIIRSLLAVLGLGLVLLVNACGVSGGVGGGRSTPTLTVTPTFPPTLTPTPLPLGSAENPYIIGVVNEIDDPQIPAAAEALGQQISDLSGAHAGATVYLTYAQMLEDMEQGKVHAAWMPALTYLYASQQGIAEVGLLTNHFGVYSYGVQFLANTSSGFTPYFDPISGLNSADAATALDQFRDRRPCWVDPLSATGYILPAGLLRLNNINTPPAVITQSHPAVVRALYIQGICDFGATFAISGDPRTSSSVQNDLPDVMNRIIVIWRSDAVIPNINLSLLAGLSEAHRQTLITAFLDLAQTPDGKALLSRTAGNYQIDDIKTINDDFYNPLREAAQVLDIPLEDLIGK